MGDTGLPEPENMYKVLRNSPHYYSGKAKPSKSLLRFETK